MLRSLCRWSILLAVLVSGCAPETGGVRRWIELDLALGPDGTRIVSSSRTTRTNPPVDGPTLSWTLLGEGREVIAQGHVVDTREVRFEDLRTTEEHDAIPSEIGVLTVRVPQESGTLVLRDPSGLVVGRVEVTSSEQRVSSLALLSRGDVLGEPVQIRGGTEGLELLFLPEGYTEAELERFHDDVERVVDALGAQPDYALFLGARAGLSP